MYLKLRRATALACAFLLAGSAVAFADTVPADGDPVMAGNQTTVPLGTYYTGEIIQVPLAMTLTCAGSAHPDEGQVINLALGTISVPGDGTVSATSTTIGPVPASWPDDGQLCGSPVPTLASNAPSTVTMKMPTTPGANQAFTLVFTRTGANDLSGLTLVTFQVNVIVNTPPVLVLPAPISVEGSTLAGALVDYVAGATDAEDNPDPTPTCAPASGAFYPVGTTSVSCSVTDSRGLTAEGSFTITVTDSAAPTLALPSAIVAEATSASGAAVDFVASATDIVDGSVAATCTPGSGATFPLGTTTVTCSASDTAGNASSGTFDVTVGDTTAPVLSGMPADRALTTSNPAGSVVTFDLPTATDAVDGSPDVSCQPPSGSMFPVGATMVTCTATDDAGNSTSASFSVSVEFVSGVVWMVAWGEPISGSPATLVANQGRTIPIKLEIFANGVELSTGAAMLSVVPCGGGDAVTTPLDWGSGRWNGHLDTDGLRPGCHVATVTLDGVAVGSFTLDVRGAEAAKASQGSSQGTSQGRGAEGRGPKK